MIGREERVFGHIGGCAAPREVTVDEHGAYSGHGAAHLLRDAP
ncbi:hypothetical protein [Nocardia rhamnosiphila]